MNRTEDLKRLYASLTVSCLLHAAVVFTPYLGSSNDAFQTAVRGGQQSPRPLEATLVLRDSPVFRVPEAAASGARAAEPSAQHLAEEQARPALERVRGIGLLPLPAPATYYSTDQLSKRPQAATNLMLDPPESGPALITGTVVVKLWINELGAVVSVDIEKTDLPEDYSGKVIAAFKNMRFDPGEIDGRPVGTMMKIEVTYGGVRRLRR